MGEGTGLHIEYKTNLPIKYLFVLKAMLCFYGMSEVGTIANSMSPTELGALAPGCEAKILGENGKFLGPHEVGEILVKTPTIMNGKFTNF